MKMKRIVIMLYVLFLGGNFWGLPAQTNTQPSISFEKNTYRIPRISGTIKVDGILNEAEWTAALAQTLDYETYPGYNIAPPVKTDILLAYNDSYLFVAFKAFDPNPKQIRARLCDRDGFGGDDWVAVLFDTFNDSRTTYNFCCNPLGVQADMIESITDGGHQWDAIWDSAGRINAEGYIVEMAIPFSSMRFQSNQGEQTWRFNIMRSYPRSIVHTICIFPIDRGNNCLMCQAPMLVGFSGVKPGLNVEIDPTLSGKITQKRESYTSSKFDTTNKKIEPGLTARWSISPNLTLTGTINPDFSNVEADVAQLDINTQFTLDYNEKRPFFTEGFNIFQTRFRAVNSRAVVEPDWGVKLTGKIGHNDLGFFSAEDSAPILLIPGRDNSSPLRLNEHTMDTVFRYRRDIGQKYNFGLLVTDREGKDYFNRLLGMDGDFKLTHTDRIRFQFMGSQTDYPDQLAQKYGLDSRKFDGTALDLVYNHKTANINWYFIYEDVGAKFRADLGFMPQVDFRHYQPGIFYNWNHRGGYWYSLIQVGSRFELERDHQDEMIYNSLVFWTAYQGPMQSNLTLTGRFGKKNYLGHEYSRNQFVFNAAVNPKRLALTLDGTFGDEIDYLNGQAGRIMQLSPTIEYHLEPNLTFNLNHVFETLDVKGGRLYRANLTNVKVIYQFNNNTFLRVMLGNKHYKLTPELYSIKVEDYFKQFFMQILFSYKINPRTVFLLGYSDNYGTNKEVNYLLKQTDRTVFIKIGYALVL